MKVQEIDLDYTHCDQAPTTFEDMPLGSYSDHFRQGGGFTTPMWKQSKNSSAIPGQQTVCSILFGVEHEMQPPILLYYRMTNFYQNHRRYVQSINEDQIKGLAMSSAALNSADDCKPLITDPVSGLPYYPCGLIANSRFNGAHIDVIYSEFPISFID